MMPAQAVDSAFRIYQRHAWKTIRLVSVPLILSYLALIFFITLLWPQFLLTSDTSRSVVQVVELATIIGVSIAVALPVFGLGLGHALTIAISIAKDAVHGREPDEQGAVRNANRLFWKQMGLIWVVGFRASIGLLLGLAVVALSDLITVDSQFADMIFALLSVGGLLVLAAGVFLFLLVPFKEGISSVVLALEDVGVRGALRRSRFLSRGAPYEPNATGSLLSLYFAIFLGFLILIFGFGSLFSIVIEPFIAPLAGSGIVQSAVAEAVRTLPWYLMMLFLVPLAAIGLTVVYYDRRVRIEAYDIETLAQNVLQTKRKKVLLS
jgi:hypothetical protein